MDKKNSAFLNQTAVFSVAFGCIIGWGCFIMPATTFLPKAGVLGSVAGIAVAAVFAMLMCYNYYSLIKAFPDSGSTYQLIRNALGTDYAFFAIWSLLLAYMAVLWANASAMGLLGRFFMGDRGGLGFCYSIMGYDIYLSDIMISVLMIFLSILIVRTGYRIVMRVMAFLAASLIISVVVLFIGMLKHAELDSLLYPHFALSLNMSKGSQVLTIAILAPWLFLGFETVTRAITETKLSVKRIFIAAGLAIAAGFFVYAAMVLFSNCGIPENYRTWEDYMAAGERINAFGDLPTLYGVRRHMGVFGMVFYSAAFLSALFGSCVGYMTAASHTLKLMARDSLAPGFLAKENSAGVPQNALWLLGAASVPVFFFGMNMISFAMDISTLSIAIVYGCVSVGALLRNGGRRVVRLHAAAGMIASFGIFLMIMVPNLMTGDALVAQDYMILAVWSLLGLVYYRFVLSMDSNGRLGRSMSVWLFMFFLLLYSTNMWTKAQTEADLLAEPDKKAFPTILMTGNLIHIIVVGLSLIILFELFSIILNRQKELSRKYETAEEHNKAKTSLLVNMSHDIRTPLNVISAFTDLALQDTTDPIKVEDYLNKIKQSGEHLLSLIDDVLEMNRIESGSIELSKETVNLPSFVLRLQSVLKSRAMDRNQKIIVACPPIENENIICDPRFLMQGLLFLVTNAIKYTPDGGIIELGVFQLTASENGKATYMFSVRDNGAGYILEIKERVLGSLVSDRPEKDSNINGENLEMSITRHIIELMDGHIEIELRPDSGAEVFVTLEFPVTDSPEDVKDGRELYDYSGNRILIVEDIQINRQIAAAMLEMYGFETDEAQDGEEAVALMSSVLPGHYDLVIMDIEMPRLNGYEAAKRIRALEDPINSQVPIIALTANVFEEDRKKTLNSGMNGFLSKPLDREKLMGMIAQLLPYGRRL